MARQAKRMDGTMGVTTAEIYTLQEGKSKKKQVGNIDEHCLTGWMDKIGFHVHHTLTCRLAVWKHRFIHRVINHVMPLFLICVNSSHRFYFYCRDTYI